HARVVGLRLPRDPRDRALQLRALADARRAAGLGSREGGDHAREPRGHAAQPAPRAPRRVPPARLHAARQPRAPPDDGRARHRGPGLRPPSRRSRRPPPRSPGGGRGGRGRSRGPAPHSLEGDLVIEALRANPALLKLDLYCKGIRLDDSCYIEQDGGRKILRTRAGLGSGLEVVLPGGLWTNVPVTEPFAARSPYTLHREEARYVVRHAGEGVAEVKLSPRPGWYDRQTGSGKPMTRIGTLQGTYLGIYQAKVCEYWTAKPTKVNCKFCSVGLNLGVDDADQKSVDEVMQVVRAARDESGITYVDFNTGHYDGDTYLDILEPYLARIKKELGLLVGFQTPPHRDFKRYDALREMGLNRVSFCFEIFDRERFQETCPGKHAEYGLDHYLDAVRYCAAL